MVEMFDREGPLFEKIWRTFCIVYLLFCSLLRVGLSRKRVIAFRGAARHLMDYIIGGITAVLLFAYLLYALLKPENF